MIRRRTMHLESRYRFLTQDTLDPHAKCLARQTVEKRKAWGSIRKEPIRAA